MKNAYSKIKNVTGTVNAGLCKVLIAPREWLQYPIERDFNNGNVVIPIVLDSGREFYEIEFLPETYEFEEKTKTGKAGSYFDTSVQGIVNNITPELLQVLETLRYHEVVAILKDRQRRLKVVGNKDKALTFRVSNKEISNNGGNQVVAIEMFMESEQLAPFYVE